GIFPRFSGGECDFDAFDNPAHLIWMMDLLPAPALHLFQRGTCVLVPAVVVPKDVTLPVRHPGKLRNGVRQSEELALSRLGLSARGSPDQVQLVGDRRDYIKQTLILLTRFTHEELENGDDCAARQNGDRYSCF